MSNNAEIAIKVSNVHKTFKLPHEKQSSIKGLFINMFRGKRTYEKQHVLKDISFEIKKGEFFGIVGRNGSGKSTLLKLLAGIYSPDSGYIQVNGKLTPFIELGVGFNPELTGRENVFLNGALLGFNRKEMLAMYDEIIEFAELEKFMDQKLKNYSSGMQVRLAFSIAIRAKSDILVLDEVLAVGDEAFQRKCIRVFDDYKKKKQTVVLVTHDMETVKKYCSRAILINKGEVIESGNPLKIANKYSLLNQEEQQSQKENQPTGFKIEIMDKAKNGVYDYRSKLRVKANWSPEKQVDAVGVAIYSSLGEYVFGTNTSIDSFSLNSRNSLIYEVELDIGTGSYFIVAGTFKGRAQDVVDFISDGPRFEVKEEVRTGDGIARLKHKWNLID